MEGISLISDSERVYWVQVSDNSRRGHKIWGSVTGTHQQIIPGNVPDGGLALCHTPGTCIVNHQIAL